MTTSKTPLLLASCKDIRNGRFADLSIDYRGEDLKEIAQLGRPRGNNA